MKPVVAALAMLLAAGCVGTNNVPAVQYYVLTDAAPAPRARQAGVPTRVVLLEPTSANTFYDTQRIVYSRSEGQRAYYQFAAWTDPPGRAFGELLSRRLGAPSTTSGIKGDLILQTHIVEIYHDARSTPGRVRIAVSAELVDTSGRGLGERRRFDGSAQTSSENAPAAVDAASRATAQILDDIEAWLDGYALIPHASARLGAAVL